MEHSESGMWTSSEDEVLREWLALLTRTIFIYDYTLSKYHSIFRRISIINIFLGALSAGASMCTTTLLGTYTDTSSSIISSEVSIYVSLALSIATIVATGIISIVNGIKILYGWETMINAITSHIRMAIDIRASVNVQLSLPYPRRKNVDEFMTKYTQRLEEFQASSPNIGEENYTRGNELYEEYLRHPRSVKMLIGCTHLKQEE